MAMSQEKGNYLQTVQLLLKKNQVNCFFQFHAFLFSSVMLLAHSALFFSSFTFDLVYINHPCPSTDSPERD